MNPDRVIPERETFQKANDILKRARAAEAAGVELPSWFRAIAGGVVEATRLRALDRPTALLGAALVVDAFECLSFSLQDSILDAEARPETVGGVIPSFLPGDLD